MLCKSCGRNGLTRFNGEIAIHFPGLPGLEKPIVWVWPKLFICLNCGFTDFQVPEDELARSEKIVRQQKILNRAVRSTPHLSAYRRCGGLVLQTSDFRITRRQKKAAFRDAFIMA
jgi:hypothetical protein